MKEGGWKGRSEEARERGWKSGSEGDGEVARAGERVGEWEQEEEGPGGDSSVCRRFNMYPVPGRDLHKYVR